MSRRAILTIDVQNDFCASDGALGERGEDLTDVQAAVGNMEELIAIAREQDVLRVFVRVVHNDWLDAGSWGTRHRGQGTPAAKRKAVEGTWGSEFYRIEPRPDEIVLTKTRYSAFIGTPLRQVLRGAGIEEVVLMGTQTDVCILTTAFDAIQEGFDVVVVRDCVASTRPQLHDAALEIIRIRSGVVLSLDEAKQHLSQVSPS